MRTKYCLRHELGLCPKQRPGIRPDPLFLLNNGRRLRLDFDCKSCEMTVR
jgi:putative protease